MYRVGVTGGEVSQERRLARNTVVLKVLPTLYYAGALRAFAACTRC